MKIHNKYAFMDDQTKLKQIVIWLWMVCKNPMITSRSKWWFLYPQWFFNTVIFIFNQVLMILYTSACSCYIMINDLFWNQNLSTRASSKGGSSIIGMGGEVPLNGFKRLMWNELCIFHYVGMSSLKALPLTFSKILNGP